MRSECSPARVCIYSSNAGHLRRDGTPCHASIYHRSNFRLCSEQPLRGTSASPASCIASVRGATIPAAESTCTPTPAIACAVLKIYSARDGSAGIVAAPHRLHFPAIKIYIYSHRTAWNRATVLHLCLLRTRKSAVNAFHGPARASACCGLRYRSVRMSCLYRSYTVTRWDCTMEL
jgi:hypothetical protein